MKNKGIITCVPGSWNTLADINNSIRKNRDNFILVDWVLINLDTNERFRIEVNNRDTNLVEAFTFASNNSFEANILDEINNNKYVIYLVSENISIETARFMIQATSILLKAGGVAVKVETAGVAHTASNWFALENSKELIALYYAYVTLVAEDSFYYSCGMHNLGLKDAIIASDIHPNKAAQVLNTFLLYYLVENPKLETGDTFSENLASPKYRLENIKCNFYSNDDLFYNPFGMWRLY